MLTKHNKGDKSNSAWLTNTIKFLLLLKYFFSF